MMTLVVREPWCGTCSGGVAFSSGKRKLQMARRCYLHSIPPFEPRLSPACWLQLEGASLRTLFLPDVELLISAGDHPLRGVVLVVFHDFFWGMLLAISVTGDCKWVLRGMIILFAHLVCQLGRILDGLGPVYYWGEGRSSSLPWMK